MVDTSKSFDIINVCSKCKTEGENLVLYKVDGKMICADCYTLMEPDIKATRREVILSSLIESRFKNSGIPEKFRDVTISQY